MSFKPEGKSIRLFLIGVVLLPAILTIRLNRTGIFPVFLPPAEEHLFSHSSANAAFQKNGEPTLTDFWAGKAGFIVDSADTGLPMGESDTIILPDGTWISFAHASYRSAGIRDRCGDPVPFPGCVITYISTNQGKSFSPPDKLICLFHCTSCPCQSSRDHVNQQQYPRTAIAGDQLLVVYEFLGEVYLRRSADGRRWSWPERVGYTGFWTDNNRCEIYERIGMHPFNNQEIGQCLAGGPPGIYVDSGLVTVLVGMG